MVGTTLDMNFKNTNKDWCTCAVPPLEVIVSMIFFITFAWLQG